MIYKYSQYIVPALGAFCIAGAVSVGVAMRAPAKLDIAVEEVSAYEPSVPQSLEPDSDVPTMEQIVEKHLFVKERKATGANTFPDLLVKGIYVGSESSVVLSLKSRPTVNLRVWLGDADSVVSQITDPRDQRKPIVDFLHEWDIKEISFKGITVEHFITGEVETYEVEYTPAKHVKDNAAAGYGQGKLAEAVQGGTKKTVKSTPQAGSQSTQGLMMMQLRDMMQKMTPEQRARMADRIRGGGPNQQNEDKQKNSDKKSDKKSSKKSSKKSK